MNPPPSYALKLDGDLLENKLINKITFSQSEREREGMNKLYIPYTPDGYWSTVLQCDKKLHPNLTLTAFTEKIMFSSSIAW